ncbi:MAG: hypothetical protein ACTSYS_10000 [Promethearchaeota archaeon]
MNSLVLRLIIGIPLMILGTWYIIDFKNKESRLFKTPEKVKYLFKRMMANVDVSMLVSLLSTFILGFSFTIIKSPCVSGILLSIMFKITLQNPGIALDLFNILLIKTMIAFSVGIITPIAILFILLGIGISSKKVEKSREKIRPYLRLISGIVILITTLTMFF